MMSAELGWTGSPTMARVPALSTSKAPGFIRSSPAWSRRSATGERQMFPVQTVRIRMGGDDSKASIFRFVMLSGDVMFELIFPRARERVSRWLDDWPDG